MENTTTLEAAAELIARDQTYCWHPYNYLSNEPLPLPVIGAEGAEIYLADGTTLIDAAASWWVNLHGHSHPHIINAIQTQAERFSHVMFADLTHFPAVELAEQLTKILPGHLQRTFFSDNGSTAVETALKIAFQVTGRKKVIALRDHYHGESFYLFETTFINPRAEQIEEALTDEVAAFIFEPGLMGKAGMRTFSFDILDELVGIAQERGVIAIADEVLTGFGRTGPLFATSRLCNAPDMICLAKALTGGTLPLAATCCTEALFTQPFLHGHSFCANPLGCAAALASLDLLLTDQCDQQRASIEEAHRAALPRFQRFARAEVLGTVLALEYSHKLSVKDFFTDRGILLRPIGKTIHVIPPYCISLDQIEQIYAALEESAA